MKEGMEATVKPSVRMINELSLDSAAEGVSAMSGDTDGVFFVHCASTHFHKAEPL